MEMRGELAAVLIKTAKTIKADLVHIPSGVTIKVEPASTGYRVAGGVYNGVIIPHHAVIQSAMDQVESTVQEPATGCDKCQNGRISVVVNGKIVANITCDRHDQ